MHMPRDSRYAFMLLLSLVCLCSAIAAHAQPRELTASTEDGKPLVTIRMSEGVDTEDPSAIPLVFRVMQVQQKLCRYRIEITFDNGKSGTCTKVLEVNGKLDDTLTRKCAKKVGTVGARLVAFYCSDVTP